MTDKPVKRVKDAPGLVWKKRPGGIFEARWQARTDIINRGYRIKSVRLWTGTGDPDEKEWQHIADTCRNLQGEMRAWAKGDPDNLPAHVIYTLKHLFDAYKSDPDSTYRKLRYKSRVHYNALIKLLEEEHGYERLEDLKARAFLRWHEKWSEGGRVAIAHGKIGLLRTAFNFGATILENSQCERLSGVLSGMRFKMPKARTERLTAEQANAIRAMAHARQRPSIALAQAFQFEGTLRQKDVIGEWVPMSEPGASDVTFVDAEEGINEKWLRGIRWNEIDGNLVLKHVTSKVQKEISINLRYAPMVLEEFRLQFGFDPERDDRSKLPASGPIVVSEWSGIPWTAPEFRRWWRICADACGVPREVRNMDSRAGAISEATDAGAQLEDVRHAATHSQISMTARYSRGAEEKTAKVMQLRVEHRTKKT